MTPKSSHPSPIVGVKRGMDTSSDRSNGQWSGEDSDIDDTRDSSRKRVKREHGSGSSLSVSCETCKLRKVKCDRGQPSCSWCLRNHQICEYRERKKPGLRAGYGRELESKLEEQAKVLDRVQEMLSRHESALAQLTERSGGSVLTPRSPEASVSLEPLVKETSRHTAQVPSFSSYILGSSQAASHSSSPSKQSAYPVQYNRTLEPSDEFPEADLCHHLCELYFAHVNSWLPILDREVALKTLFRVPAHKLEPAEKLLLHAIIATSLRFSKDRRLTPHIRQKLHQFSSERVQLHGLGNASVNSLQALLILTLDLIGGQNGTPLWNMMTIIVRSAEWLGLTREPPSTPTSENTMHASIPLPRGGRDEVEAERRLMWAIYIVDRLSAATSGQAYLLTGTIQRQLPTFDHHHQSWKQHYPVEPHGASQNHSDTFAHLADLAGVSSQIHDFLRLRIDTRNHDQALKWQHRHQQLEDNLARHRDGLPPRYHNPGVLLLQATYFANIICLNASSAYPYTNSSASANARSRCLHAVDNIVQILQAARRQELLSQTGPFFAFALWTAGRIAVAHSLDIKAFGPTLLGSAPSPVAALSGTGTGSPTAAAAPSSSSPLPRSPSSRHRPPAAGSPGSPPSQGSYVDVRVNCLISGLRALGDSSPIASRYADVLARVLDECRFGGADVAECARSVADMCRSERGVEDSLLVARRRSSDPLTPAAARTRAFSRGESGSRRRSCAAPPALSLVEETAGTGGGGGSPSSELFNPRLPNGFDRILDTRDSRTETFRAGKAWL